MKSKWIRVSHRLPDEGIEVETKISDDQGIRNVQNLRRKGNLWFFPDNSMYVYYKPTHWRPIAQNALSSRTEEGGER